jgi:hypothetical protein
LGTGFWSSLICRSTDAAVGPIEEAPYKTFPTSYMLENLSCNGFNGSYSLHVTPTFLNAFLSLERHERAQIEDLSLVAQYIGHVPEGKLPRLSRAFSECSVLKRLNLSSNSLDEFSKESWQALLKALPKESVLESLVLTDNLSHMSNKTNEAWKGFIAFISMVPSKKINLNYNDFSKLSPNKWEELLDALHQNPHISEVIASQEAFNVKQNTECAEMLTQKEEEKKMQSFVKRYNF